MRGDDAEHRREPQRDRVAARRARRARPRPWCGRRARSARAASPRCRARRPTACRSRCWCSGRPRAATGCAAGSSGRIASRLVERREPRIAVAGRRADDRRERDDRVGAGEQAAAAAASSRTSPRTNVEVRVGAQVQQRRHAVVERIEGGDAVPRREQVLAEDAAEVARSARDENPQLGPPVVGRFVALGDAPFRLRRDLRPHARETPCHDVAAPRP